MEKYQITGYQLIYPDGRRDNVKLLQPIIVSDIEAYRSKLKTDHCCTGANLSYVEIN